MLVLKNNIYEPLCINNPNVVITPNADYNQRFNPLHLIKVALNEEKEVIRFIERQSHLYWREDLLQFYPRAGKTNSLNYINQIFYQSSSFTSSSRYSACKFNHWLYSSSVSKFAGVLIFNFFTFAKASTLQLRPLFSRQSGKPILYSFLHSRTKLLMPVITCSELLMKPWTFPALWENK